MRERGRERERERERERADVVRADFIIKIHLALVASAGASPRPALPWPASAPSLPSSTFSSAYLSALMLSAAVATDKSELNIHPMGYAPRRRRTNERDEGSVNERRGMEGGREGGREGAGDLLVTQSD